MKKVFGKAIDNAISLGVVIIVLFLIIPIRTELLDFLLIINIGLSIMILMITMNISETLEFSIFPSLLLVTTLFRLGLNVSSTRAILYKGYAGEVIQNFGNLITGGNIVVELTMDTGNTVSLQSTMDGVYPFLDAAFSAWCRQKGIREADCPFHDPSKSWWFPHEEE